jgi:hypothetical protein
MDYEFKHGLALSLRYFFPRIKTLSAVSFLPTLKLHQNLTKIYFDKHPLT